MPIEKLLARAIRYVMFNLRLLTLFLIYVNNIFFFSIKIEFPHNVRIQKFELKVIINNGYPFVSVEGQLIRCAKKKLLKRQYKSTSMSELTLYKKLTDSNI